MSVEEGSDPGTWSNARLTRLLGAFAGRLAVPDEATDVDTDRQQAVVTLSSTHDEYAGAGAVGQEIHVSATVESTL